MVLFFIPLSLMLPVHLRPLPLRLLENPIDESNRVAPADAGRSFIHRINENTKDVLFAGLIASCFIKRLEGDFKITLPFHVKAVAVGLATLITAQACRVKSELDNLDFVKRIDRAAGLLLPRTEEKNRVQSSIKQTRFLITAASLSTSLLALHHFKRANNESALFLLSAAISLFIGSLRGLSKIARI